MDISLGTLISLGTTTTSTNDGIYISNDDIATTLTSTISTATTSGGPIIEVHAAAARDYVSSMSVEEIDTMLMQIEEKEMELSFDGDNVKVKKLGSNDIKKI
ncbi:MAG: hypothetical protein IJN90_06570 [Bacilli bacterium]|nr:hypothetical protein [Bacilli bacterium]